MQPYTKLFLREQEFVWQIAFCVIQGLNPKTNSISAKTHSSIIIIFSYHYGFQIKLNY